MRHVVPLLLLLAAPSLAASPLRLALGDSTSPPYLEDGSGRPHGRLIALAEMALARCKLAAQYEVLPTQRLMQELQQGQQDSTLLLSYHTDRAAFLSYPMRGAEPDARLRLATLNYRLYVRNDDKLRWDGRQLSGQSKPLGTNNGWSIARKLRERGVEVEEAPSVTDNFKKLLAGRIQAYVVDELTGDDYLAHHPDLHLRELSPPVQSKDYYWTFTRDYAQKHPQEVRCVWQQLPALRPRFLGLPPHRH